MENNSNGLPPFIAPPRRHFGVYLHIPFCLKNCPYCDFNSYERAAGAGSFIEEEQRYVHSLIAEIRAAFTPGASIWSEKTIVSIFFGGGTPSLLSGESVGQILQALSGSAPLAGDCEITLESNPGTIAEELGAEKLSAYRSAGVNRISLGGQSFSAEKLQFLGRIHPAGAIGSSIANIRAAGFSNYNIDLMFGAAGEQLSAWSNDIESALALEPKHLSVYSLTIEPGTEFGRLDRRGQRLTADEETVAAMFGAAQQRLGAAGFGQYEISNYSLPGYQCRHNLGYWRRQSYLGLGAGAHSFWLPAGADSEAAARSQFGAQFSSSGLRWSNIPGPAHYCSRVEAGGEARQRLETLDQKQAKVEALFLGLRTAGGVSLESPDFTAEERSRLLKAGTADQFNDLLRLENGAVSCTPRGFLFINSVIEQLVGAL